MRDLLLWFVVAALAAGKITGTADHIPLLGRDMVRVVNTLAVSGKAASWSRWASADGTTRGEGGADGPLESLTGLASIFLPRASQPDQPRRCQSGTRTAKDMTDEHFHKSRTFA